MNSESIIDKKGRVCIPVELRKKLNLKAGEKLLFQVKEGTIIMIKATKPKEFIERSKIFRKHLQEVTDEPIPVKKIFD